MAFPTGWTGKKKVTIDNTKVSGSSNLTNFPVLIKDSNIPTSVYSGMQTGEINGNALLSDANTEAYYRFESGALTTDSSGNGNTLTNNNTVGEISTGRFGYAADFGASNTNKSFSLASNAGIVLTSDYSVSFWLQLKTEISTGTYEILHLDDNTGKAKLYIQYQYNSGTRRLHIQQDRWVIAGYSIDYNITLGTSNKYLITLRKTGTTLYLLVNNVVVGSVTDSNLTTAGTTAVTNGLYIGYNGSTNYSSVIVDDLLLSSKALSLLEIRNIYYGGGDIRFTTDLSGTTEIPFEIVSLDYSGETGEIWVKVPTVYYNTDTVFYIWYGDNTATPYAATDTYGSQNVWTNYNGVYHYESRLADSSSGGYTLTQYGSPTDEDPAVVRRGVDFGASNSANALRRATANGITNSDDFVMSTWFKVKTYPVGYETFMGVNFPTSGYCNAYYRYVSGTTYNIEVHYGGTATQYTVDLGTTNYHHIVAKKSGSGITILLDGASVATGSTGTAGGGTNQIYLGSSSGGGYVSAIMDESRYRKGTNPSNDWYFTEYNNQGDYSNFLAITDLVTTTSVTKDLDYAILTEGLIQKDTAYKVIPTYSLTKSSDYTIINTIAAITKQADYAIKTILGITKDTDYYVKPTYSITKTAQYGVLRTIAAITKGLEYSILPPSVVVMGLDYLILTSLGITKDMAYRITLTNSLTKQFAYAVLTDTNITKTLDYYIFLGSVVQKDLAYYVLSNPSLEKQLDYAIYTYSSIQKSLDYIIGITTAITKDIAYKVQASVDVTKTMQYAIGVGGYIYNYTSRGTDYDEDYQYTERGTTYTDNY